MSLLPQSYLKAVVSIGVESKATPFSPIGTGFLMGIKDNNDLQGQYHLYLVTNRHVLSDLETVLLRFNLNNGSSQIFPIVLKDKHGLHWSNHPDTDVDISVVIINPSFLKERGIDYSFFEIESVLTKKRMTEIGVSNGDEVFVLGFPMGLVGIQRNYPITRDGIIARIDEESLNREKQFYIDASIYGGNSGGPVIIKPSMFSIAGTTPINIAYLLGVVKSVQLDQQTLYSQGNGGLEPRMILYEHANLGQVIPMDYVYETIDFLKSKIDSSFLQSAELDRKNEESKQNQIEVKNFNSQV